ncbi:EamA family transporter [Candidatus Woesearchaeota archaeon]|nr:EamA family transporter [Candidatus Woesearchaeota archaeon]
MVASWIILALISALLVSSSSILEKRTLLHQHAMEFITVLSICTAIFTMPLFFMSDTSSISLNAIAMTFIASFIGSLAALLTAKAVRHIAISLSSPLLAFTPLATLIIAVIFLGEKVTGIQVTGILVLMAGAYFLQSHAHDNVLEPLKQLFKSKHIRYMLLAVMFYGISSVLDKKILGAEADGGLGVPALAYLPLNQFFQAIILVVMMLIFHDGFKGVEQGIRSGWKPILLIGFLLVWARLSYTFALSLPGVLVSLFIPIKRLGIIFTTFFGGRIFHEKEVIRRSLACVVMLIGAVLILF